MSITTERKLEVITQFKQSDNDTGSSSVQVAILSERIKNLTEHFKTHKKDNHSRRGLIRLINLRRRHLDYLKKRNKPEYERLLADLGIRK